MNDAGTSILEDAKNYESRYMVYESINANLYKELEGLIGKHSRSEVPDSEIEASMQKLIKNYNITGMRCETIGDRLREMKDVAFHRMSHAQELIDEYRTKQREYKKGEFDTPAEFAAVLDDVEFRYKEYIDDFRGEYDACKSIIDFKKCYEEIMKKENSNASSNENQDKRKSQQTEKEQEEFEVPEGQPKPRRQPEPDYYEEEEELEHSNIIQFRPPSSPTPRQNNLGNDSRTEEPRKSIRVLRTYFEDQLVELNKKIEVLKKYTSDVPKPKQKALLELAEKQKLYDAVQQKLDSITDDMTFSEVFNEEDRVIDKIGRIKPTVDRYDKKLEKIYKKTKELKAKKAYYKDKKIPVISCLFASTLQQSISSLNYSEIKIIKKQRRLVDMEIKSFYKRFLATADINVPNNVQQASNGHGSR